MPDQAQNAAIIAAVAASKGLADHAVTVALATSLQESQLHNIPYGDRDSVGLFQQRPSQGWGTPSQILDPVYSASAFYDHLVQIPGWETLAVTSAAQEVQHSASPSAYATWEAEARQLASVLTGEVPAGLTCHLLTFSGPRPPSGALNAADVHEFGSKEIGVTVGTKLGWQIAVWAVAHAYSYHLESVTFEGRTWMSNSGTWQTGSSNVPIVTVQSGA
jgi:hypothetical protein